MRAFDVHIVAADDGLEEWPQPSRHHMRLDVRAGLELTTAIR